MRSLVIFSLGGLCWSGSPKNVNVTVFDGTIDDVAFCPGGFETVGDICQTLIEVPPYPQCISGGVFDPINLVCVEEIGAATRYRCRRGNLVTNRKTYTAVCEVEVRLKDETPCPSGYVFDLIASNCVREPGSRCYESEGYMSAVNETSSDSSSHSHKNSLFEACPPVVSPQCKDALFNSEGGYCYRIEEHMPVISCAPGYTFKARIKSAYAWYQRSYLLCAKKILKTANYLCPPGFVSLPTEFADEDDGPRRRLHDNPFEALENSQKQQEGDKTGSGYSGSESIFKNRKLQEIPPSVAAQIIAAYGNITSTQAPTPRDSLIANQLAALVESSPRSSLPSASSDPIQFAIKSSLISPEEQERLGYPAPSSGAYFVTSTTVNDNGMAGGPGGEKQGMYLSSRAYKSLYTFLSTAAGSKEATRAEALEETVMPQDTIPSLQIGSVLGSGEPIFATYPPKCVMTVGIPLAHCTDAVTCVNKYVLKFLKYLQNETNLPINWKDYKKNLSA